MADSLAQTTLEQIRVLLAAGGGGGGGGPVTQATTPWVTGDTTAQTKLQSIITALAGVLGVTVGNFPADFPNATAATKLEAIRVAVTGTLATADATAQTKLEAIRAAVVGTLTIAGAVSVTNFPASQPVTAAALPLPAGAALEAGGNLAAAKADLDTLVARTPANGPATMANSSPVVLATDQTPIPTTDAANGTPGAMAPAKAELNGATDANGLLRALVAELVGGQYALKVDDDAGRLAAAKLQAALDDIRVSQAMSAGRMIPY